MYARAEIVDAIREWLPSQPRPRGLASICSALHCDDIDATAALRYLRKRGEVMHQSTQGWVYLPLVTRQRIKEAMAR